MSEQPVYEDFIKEIRSQNISKVYDIPDIFYLMLIKYVQGKNLTSDDPKELARLAYIVWPAYYNDTYQNLIERDGRINTEMLIFGVLFVFSLITNISGLFGLTRKGNRRARVNRLLIHLTVADLMTTLFTMPMEIGWRVTIQWVAGDFACRVFQFFRIFGPFASSAILVCIALDRYYAFVRPLQFRLAEERTKTFIRTAWIFSFVSSIPQVVVVLLI